MLKTELLVLLLVALRISLGVLLGTRLQMMSLLYWKNWKKSLSGVEVRPSLSRQTAVEQICEGSIKHAAWGLPLEEDNQ